MGVNSKSTENSSFDEGQWRDVCQYIFSQQELFNKIVDGGKGVDQLTKREALDRFEKQIPIVMEELDETLKALDEDDVVEVYDGYVDVIYTAARLAQLADELEDDYLTEEDKDFSLQIQEKLKDLAEQRDILNTDLFKQCAELICENNMSKFTTDDGEFVKWKAPKGVEYIRTSQEVDGVVYHFFTDDNGKVKKRDGFVGVNLTGVLSTVLKGEGDE